MGDANFGDDLATSVCGVLEPDLSGEERTAAGGRCPARANLNFDVGGFREERGGGISGFEGVGASAEGALVEGGGTV
jgi:hypothetical protein